MTLTSKFAIAGPVLARDAHDFVTELVRPHGHVLKSYEPQEEKGVITYRNVLGQGLHSLIWTEGGIEGPVHVVKYCWDEETEREWEEPLFACNVLVHMDTPYGYKSASDAGCSDQHAYLMMTLAEWAKAKSATWWKWYDEFNDEWHDGIDDLYQFGDATKGSDMSEKA
jgi:hypothetical protein